MRTVIPSIPFAAPPLRRRWFDLAGKLLWLPVVWYGRMQTRFELEALSDEQLRDVGLSRDDVRQEIDKPFWRG